MASNASLVVVIQQAVFMNNQECGGIKVFGRLGQVATMATFHTSVQ